LGNVLVTDIGEVVSTVDIIPDPLSGKVHSGQHRANFPLDGF